jgi:hypothetical protein
VGKNAEEVRLRELGMGIVDGQLNGEIETLIDRRGLYRVLERIAFVCGEKAEHLNSITQPNSLARRWVKASVAVGKLANKLRDPRV